MIMKRLLPAVIVILLFGAPMLSGQERAPASDTEKIERTRAILAENTSSSPDAKQHVPGPWKTDIAPDLGGAGVSMFKSLAFCLGIFLVGLAVYKKISRRSENGSSKRIRIIERTPLTHRSALVLLEIDGKKILASTGQDCVSFLDMDGAAREENAFEQSLKEACVKEH